MHHDEHEIRMHLHRNGYNMEIKIYLLRRDTNDVLTLPVLYYVQHLTMVKMNSESLDPTTKVIHFKVLVIKEFGKLYERTCKVLMMSSSVIQVMLLSSLIDMVPCSSRRMSNSIHDQYDLYDSLPAEKQIIETSSIFSCFKGD